MRILVVMPPFEVYSPATGGAVSTVAEGLARAWTAAGHDLVVATAPHEQLHRTGRTTTLDFPRRTERSRLQRVWAGADRRLLRHDWPDYRHYSRQVLHQVESVRPDRVIVHNDMVLPGLLPVSLRAATVVHVHNQVTVRHRARASTTLDRTGAVVAVSDVIRVDVQRRFDPPRLSTIPNGVDSAAFRPARPRHRAGGAPLRVGYLGRLLRDKGPHVLLEAAEKLYESGLRLRITIAGSPDFGRAAAHDSDPYVVEVRDRLQRLDGRYVPHLHRQAVAGMLQELDVLVVPSLFPEPFGLVVLEGMAAGCAVLASDIGGLPESVGTAGQLFPPGDSAALASMLHHLAEHPGNCEALAAAGSSHAEKHDWTLIGDRWLPLLESLT